MDKLKAFIKEHTRTQNQRGWIVALSLTALFATGVFILIPPLFILALAVLAIFAPIILVLWLLSKWIYKGESY